MVMRCKVLMVDNYTLIPHSQEPYSLNSVFISQGSTRFGGGTGWFLVTLNLIFEVSDLKER